MEESIFSMAMSKFGKISMDALGDGIKKISRANDGDTLIVADKPNDILDPAISNVSPRIGIFADPLPKIFISNSAETQSMVRFLSISISPAILIVPPIETLAGPTPKVGVFSMKLPNNDIFPEELNTMPRDMDGMNEKFADQKPGMLIFWLNRFSKFMLMILEIS